MHGRQLVLIPAMKLLFLGMVCGSIYAMSGISSIEACAREEDSMDVIKYNMSHVH